MCKNRVLRELDRVIKTLDILGSYSLILLLLVWVFPDFYKEYKTILDIPLFMMFGWGLLALINTMESFIKDVISYINKDSNAKVKCNELES